MSDDDVDEDIESTRLVQAIESAGEWSLRDLRSRLASAPLPAGSGTREDVLPLAPARVVGALCACLQQQAVEPGLRLAVLRLVGDTLAADLALLYQRHAELLANWGVEPARYTIRREPEARPKEQQGAKPVGVATAQIPALLAHVAAQAGLGSGMQELLARLAAPVARSVAADKHLLDSMDNPLWRLIDRLAALGQLDTDAGGGLQLPLHLRLEPIIARLEQGAQPLSPQRYAQALVEAEAEALGVADTTTAPATLHALRSQALSESFRAAASGPAPVPAPAESAPAPAPAQSLESLVRGQMIARLRDVPVLPEVKQFLLGPWLGVVTRVVTEQGEDSPAAQRVLGAVESLIDAGSHRRRAPLTRAELDCLRMEAEEGLAKASALPAERVRQHVEDLSQALAAWPRPAPEAEETLSAALDEDERASLLDWPSHDELATVPIALDAHNPDERALRDCETWLDGLGVGDVCRVQRQGQWATLRLNWRNEPGTYFAFGNATGLAFCVSRRVLGRLRLEGLATTMARGQWLRRAVDTLPMSLE
jgi:hypothetical protein